MKSLLKLVIFDLDGTLANAYPAIEESVNFTLQKLRHPKENSYIIKRAVGWGDKNLLLSFVSESEIDKALTIYRRHHKSALRRKSYFLPFAKQLLIFLKRKKFKLALASNRPTQFTHIILNHLKIKKLFSSVLCADKVKRGKPHPDILLSILERLSLKSSEALYVGDMTLDVLAGKRAKIKTIAVLGGSSTRKELTALKPHKIVSDLSLVSKIVKNMC